MNRLMNIWFPYNRGNSTRTKKGYCKQGKEHLVSIYQGEQDKEKRGIVNRVMNISFPYNRGNRTRTKKGYCKQVNEHFVSL